MTAEVITGHRSNGGNGTSAPHGVERAKLHEVLDLPLDVAGDPLAELEATVATKPFLVRRANGSIHVIEDGTRRELRSGLLAAALTEALGVRRNVTDAELGRWTEGAPVDVLQGPSGRPFVVLGGERRPLRGLPVPTRVSRAASASFSTGATLDVAKANVPRNRLDHALERPSPAQRARAAVDRNGSVWRAAAAVVRRRLRRLVNPSTGRTD